MPVHRRDHCRAPNRLVPCPTGMLPRSAAPATPRSGAGSPRTRAAVVDRGPPRETQTGTRMSALEPRRDRSPRWCPHGCAGMSAKSAMAALGAGSCICVWTGRAVQAGCNDLEIIGLAHLYSAHCRERFLLPGHHGYPRASDLIRDKALEGRKYIKITDATVRPFLHLLNPTRRPRQESFGV